MRLVNLIIPKQSFSNYNINDNSITKKSIEYYINLEDLFNKKDNVFEGKGLDAKTIKECNYNNKFRIILIMHYNNLIYLPTDIKKILMENYENNLLNIFTKIKEEYFNENFYDFFNNTNEGGYKDINFDDDNKPNNDITKKYETYFIKVQEKINNFISQLVDE